jgi:uncharacterized protein (DUF1697 family)
MADLRDLFERLGHHDVRTLLNSGNVIFRAGPRSREKAVAAIEAAIPKRFGFRASVLVLTAEELAAIVADNPLARPGRDPSRLLVAFVDSAQTLKRVQPLVGETRPPEILAVGPRAAYLWCPNGIIASKLMQAFTRATGDAATTRNWATVLKLLAACGGHCASRAAA